jgi:hypothetical protein
MLSRPAAVVNRPRPATVLRWAWRRICVRASSRSPVRTSNRRPSGWLLSAECCKFAASLEKAVDELNVLRCFLGFILGLQLSLQSRETVEKQLGNVGQGNGVATGDAFARELLDEIAEKEIHGAGGGEVLDLAEQVGGEGFGIDHGNVGCETAGVVGTERRAFRVILGAMSRIDQHVTTLAAGVLVLALTIGVLFWGHGFAFRKMEVTTQRNKEVRKKADPSLRRCIRAQKSSFARDARGKTGPPSPHVFGTI